MKEEDCDLLLKLVLIGDTCVGKSNILLRYVHDYFEQDSKSTIGVDFAAKDLLINDKAVKVQIWDTAGQEKFRSIIKGYYSNANGFIIVYDVTNHRSFDNIGTWIEAIKANANKSAKVLIIGNKIDLEEDRIVSPIDGQKLAELNGFFYMETSAKTNVDNCVEKAFGVLIEEIFIKIEEEESNMIDNGISNIYKDYQHRLSVSPGEGMKKNGGCCGNNK